MCPVFHFLYPFIYISILFILQQRSLTAAEVCISIKCLILTCTDLLLVPKLELDKMMTLLCWYNMACIRHHVNWQQRLNSSVLHCFDEKITCDSNIIKCILDAYIFHKTSNVNKTLIASHCRTMFILNLYSMHYSLKPTTVVPVNASSARALPRR